MRAVAQWRERVTEQRRQAARRWVNGHGQLDVRRMCLHTGPARNQLQGAIPSKLRWAITRGVTHDSQNTGTAASFLAVQCEMGWRPVHSGISLCNPGARTSAGASLLSERTGRVGTHAVDSMSHQIRHASGAFLHAACACEDLTIEWL